MASFFQSGKSGTNGGAQGNGTGGGVLGGFDSLVGGFQSLVVAPTPEVSSLCARWPVSARPY
jgi:hypothetical protein